MADPVSRYADNPYAAPPEPGPDAPGGHDAARMDEGLLVVPHGVTFPPLCVKCAAHEPLTHRTQAFAYAPAWARLFGVLLMVLVQRRSTLVLPLCPRCDAAWKRWNVISRVGFLGPLLALVFLGGVLFARGDADAGNGVFGLALVAGLVGGTVSLRFRRQYVVFATRINERETWLRGVHETAMRAATTRPPSPARAN